MTEPWASPAPHDPCFKQEAAKQFLAYWLPASIVHFRLTSPIRKQFTAESAKTAENKAAALCVLCALCGKIQFYSVAALPRWDLLRLGTRK
jgi:hypothetical protein